MTLGAPLHQAPKETKKWNDKRTYHGGVRQTHYDMLLTAQKMKPFWGATLIDGFEGMQGNGPASGTPVASRIAIASRDYIAADRVGVKRWGLIQAGRVPAVLLADGVRPVRPEQDRYRRREPRGGSGRATSCTGISSGNLQWMGPMTDVPPKLG